MKDDFNPSDLLERVFVVTGALGSLGRAVVARLISYSARIVMVDKSATPPSDPARYLVCSGVDLAQSEAAVKTMHRASVYWGGVGGLVNIAGGFSWQTLINGNIGVWQSLSDLNVMTAVLASKVNMPYTKKRGGDRIVNIGAGGAMRGGKGMGPYAVSKAGVVKLTESLAEELKDDKITVNAVLPNIIDTPRNRKEMPDADFKHWVQPDAIAAVIAFLASDAAYAVTGAPQFRFLGRVE
jgi:NAD(P)-dependent dehydrogenase (short-subunit alcohol dehydrogenase family)